MTEIFLPQVDFGELLNNVARQGWAFEPDGISIDLCREVVMALAGLDLTRYSKHTDAVDVDTESCVLRLGQDVLPEPIRLLHEKLTQQVKMRAPRSFPGLKCWLPNEVTIQRFTEPSDQVSKHQDFSADRELIVVCTVQGAGPFNLFKERTSIEPYHRCETATGSIAMLVATSLAGDEIDRRPVHEAGSAYCLPRTTVTFRMVVGNKPG
jgi:hypothetical protein